MHLTVFNIIKKKRGKGKGKRKVKRKEKVMWKGKKKAI